MVSVQGQIKEIDKTYKSTEMIISLTNAAPSTLDKCINLKGKDLRFEIKRQKRSLSANSYAWELMSQIAECMQIPVETVYKRIIRELGDASVPVTIEAKYADRICSDWEDHGLGWQTERAGDIINGRVDVILYQGSSSFDSKQMSDFIELIKQECYALDIETMTPNEINSLITEWSN